MIYRSGYSNPERSNGERQHPAFPSDAWIASSVLQKAIRRGEADLALAAAYAYARRRGRGVWRRLLIVAFEDVSIGAPEAVLETVNVCASLLSLKKPKLDPERLALLVGRLADAPKDRAPDHLLTAAWFSPRLDDARLIAFGRSVSDQVSVVADTCAPILERALAAKFALGLDEQGRIPAGDLGAEALFQVFRDLGVPADLVAATRAAAALTSEPIAMMTPLLWLEAERAGSRSVTDQAVPTSPSLDGVPAYGFDKHTALGKAAILRFARENKPVRDAISKSVRADRAGAVACMAVFHTEGSAIASRRLWSGALELERLGVEADMSKAGVTPADTEAVLEAVRDNLNDLHSIRAELFRRPKR